MEKNKIDFSNRWVQALILLVITAVPFLFYIFGRVDLVGADSYYFMNEICSNGLFKSDTALTGMIFSILPCNIIVAKLVLFLCCFVSVLLLARIGSLFNTKYGWTTGFFVFLIPDFFFTFLKFENDAVSVPFLLLATFFFFKKKKFDHFIAIFFLIIAGLIWEGTIFYAIGLGLSSWIIGIFAAILIVWKIVPIIAVLVPDWTVQENIFGASFRSILFGYFGLLKTYRVLLPQIIFFLLLGMWKAKFIFLVAPFLAIGLMKFVSSLSPKLQKWAYYVALLFILSECISLLYFMPTIDQTEAVKFAIAESGDGFVQNDWDFGHWVVFYGGSTESRFHSSWQREFGEGIVLSKHFQPDCVVLKEFKDVNVYRCSSVRLTSTIENDFEDSVIIREVE